VGQCVRGNGGGSALHSLARAGAASFWSNSKTELLELGFGRADGNCGVGRWEEVVGRCVGGNGGSSALRSLARAGTACFWSKSKTELLELGFGRANGNCGMGRWDGPVRMR